MGSSNSIEKKLYYEEKILKGQMKPVSRDAYKIIDNQMDKFICKIYGINEKVGTGFFCKIPFPDEFKLIPVLITNNHILNENEILNDRIIKISLDDDKIKKDIKKYPERKSYTSSKYDTTIIEIFPDKDDIRNFLDLENNFTNSEKEYREREAYVLQYPKGNKCSVSFGNIIDINEFNIIHKCSTEHGSSGGPIILLNIFKVIGVHKGSSTSNFEFNLGTLLKFPINEFYSKFNDSIKINSKNEIHSETDLYSINNGIINNINEKKNDRNYLILVLGRTGVGKTTLINSILNYKNEKKISKYEPFTKGIKHYTNKNKNYNLDFLDTGGINYYQEKRDFYAINDEVNQFIQEKFKSKEPEKYIDCIWFCITWLKIENYEIEWIRFLRERFKGIPLLFVYTKAVDRTVVNSFKKYFKSYFNVEIIPIIAQRIELINSYYVEAYGIDELIKQTIQSCKKKSKNVTNN